MDFNIRHVVIIGLAMNRKCTNIINEIYYKNEELYNKAYLERGLREDYLKKIFTMKTEDMVNKLSGIMEVCYEKNDFSSIKKIMNKAHPSIVNFVKNSSTVDTDIFVTKYKLYDYIEDELFSIIASIVFLAYKSDKVVQGSSTLYFMKTKWGLFTDVLNLENAIKKRLKMNREKRIEEIDGFIDEGYALFDMNREDNIDTTLEIFISDNIENIVCKELKVKDVYELKNVLVEDYEHIRDNTFKVGINRYIGSFSRYINTLGFDSSEIFVETPMSNDVLENIFVDFNSSYRANDVPKEDLQLYTASCLFIYNLIHLYKDAKDIYLNKAYTDKYNELMAIEEKLQIEKIKFDEKIFNIKSKEKNQKEEIERLAKKVKELEKENKLLLSKTEKDKKTINMLNKEVRKQKDEITLIQENLIIIDKIEPYKEINMQDKIAFINRYKIGICGGMSSIKSLSDKIENVSYYSNQNEDMSSINRLDMVFMITDFLSHAFSNKIKSECINYKIPSRYIKGTNDNIIIESIYSLLKKEKDLD